MIEINNVSHYYGDKAVVDQVKLNIPEKGIVSIIGPNGAGKSTLLSMMSRLLNFKTGEIWIDNLNVQNTPNSTLAKKLSILKQDNHISAKLTVRDLVCFGRYPHSQGKLNEQDLLHINAAIKYLNLTDYENRFLDELSGGQRQRAFVAMVLCQDTPYVFLDEPLNNLDLPHAVAMMKQLRTAADELNKAFVLVIHDLNFASCYSDHIIALRQGSVVFEGSPEALMTTQTLQSIYDLSIDVHTIDGRKIAVYY